MNLTSDFQRALETALADSDLRLMRFTSVFTCEVNSAECRALSAPGLSDRFPLMRGQKRSARATDSSGAGEEGPSKSAKRRARQGAAAKAKANAATEENRRRQQQARGGDGGGRGGGGGGGGGGKAGGKGKPTGGGGGGGGPSGGGGRDLPAGAKDRTDDNRLICFAYSRGSCTRGAGCRFAHVCWWCEGKHPGGQQKTCSSSPAGAGAGLG